MLVNHCVDNKIPLTEAKKVTRHKKLDPLRPYVDRQGELAAEIVEATSRRMISLAGLSEAAVLVVAVWSSWRSAEREALDPEQPPTVVNADDLGEFAAQVREFARFYMADDPESRESVMQFVEASGVDARAAELEHQRRLAKANIAKFRDEEEVLRRRVDELSEETARLERIVRMQRQPVADVMNEWTTAQERAIRHYDGPHGAPGHEVHGARTTLGWGT